MENISVMIVEDETELAKLMKNQLEQSNYNVIGIYNSAEEAILILENLSKQNNLPDIIIMDVRLKGKLTGIEASIIIKEKFNLTIIIVTGFLDNDLQIESCQMKSYTCLLKPVTAIQLRITIENALYQKNLEMKLIEEKNKIELLNKELEKRVFNRTKQIIEKNCIINKSPLIIFTIDVIDNFKVKYVSENINQFGYDQEEFISGKINLFDIILPFERKEVISSFKDNLRKNENGFKTEFRIFTNTGKPIWVENITWRRETEDGENRQIHCIIYDINEKKYAQYINKENLLFQKVLLETIPYPIFYKNIKGVYLGCNTAFLNFFSLQRKHVIGHSDYSIINNKFIEDFIESDKLCIDNNQVISFETKILNKGNEYYIRVFKAPFPQKNKKVGGIVGVIQDNTKQKNIESKLNDSIYKAEVANKSKSEFLASMSHEIRTPINAIFGTVELLLMTDLDKEQSDYLETIQASSESLLGLINDILDISKIEANKIELENIDFDFRENIYKAIKVITLKAQEKGLDLFINIDGNIPNFIKGDPIRFRQIIINLVNNAIKFTKKGYIFVEALKKSDSEVINIEFSIKDTGIGISKDKINRLFKKFSQVDSSTTRKYGGTGLGLVICKRLIGLMNGKINVYSEEGKGATFIFNCYFNKSDKKAKENKLNELSDIKNILLIDNNEFNYKIISNILKNYKFNIVFKENSYKGLEDIDNKIKVNKLYDCIIVQNNLPIISGTEIIKKIRENIKTQDIPVIFLVLINEKANKNIELNNLKINEFLSKPIIKHELINCLENIFIYKKVVKDEKKEEKKKIKLKKNLNILLAEDNPINIKIEIAILKKEGLNVISAVNGKEAVDLYLKDSKKYNLILMDMQMPVMDGIEATKIIRREEIKLLKRVPIIALTANAMNEDKKKCLDAGMDDFMVKPFKKVKLYEIINKYTKNIKTWDTEIIQDNGILNLVDYNQLVKNIGGDKSFANELLEDFKKIIPIQVEDIKNLCENDNFDDILKITNTMKDQIINLCINNKILKIVESIEDNVRLKSTEKILIEVKSIIYHLKIN